MNIFRLRAIKAAIAALFAFAAPLGAATAQQARPPIAARPPALNHVYVVLDAATYAAIRDSRELAATLGRSDGGLPDYAPPEAGADRIFFRGRRTYLEFFAPDNRFKEPVGKVGLALAHDEPAPFDALEAAWRKTCGDRTRRTRVEWRRTQPPVPWYDAVQCDDTAAGADLATWAMVYRPEFLRWQLGGTPDGVTRTTRADLLAPRVAAGQGRFDVTGVAIEVGSSLHAKLVAQFEQAGFRREDLPGGTRLSGDGWELLLRQGNGSAGLVSLDLATDSVSSVVPLGKARLAKRPAGRARLEFGTLKAD